MKTVTSVAEMLAAVTAGAKAVFDVPVWENRDLILVVCETEAEAQYVVDELAAIAFPEKAKIYKEASNREQALREYCGIREGAEDWIASATKIFPAQSSEAWEETLAGMKKVEDAQEREFEEINPLRDWSAIDNDPSEGAGSTDLGNTGGMNFCH